MDTPSPSLRNLAERLLAAEVANDDADPRTHEAVRVIQKLRISLTRFAGPEGFASLLRRALALAAAEVPSLRAVTIRPDGLVEGLQELAGDARHGSGRDAAVAITAHLLGLLATFVGEPLTLRLVREAWPDASTED